MRLTFRLTSVLLLVLGAAMALPPSARGQTADDVLRFSQRTPATGARMMGMAGAGIAGFADYGMLFTNPAGLGYFQTSQAAGALGILSTTEESRYRVPGPGAEPSLLDETATAYGGNLALVYTFPTTRGSLVFGGGVNQVQTFARHLSYQGVPCTPQTCSSVTETFLPSNDEYDVDEQGVFFPGDIPSNVIPFIAYQGGAIEFYGGDYEAGRYPFEPAVLPGTAAIQVGDVIEEGQLYEANFAAAFEAARGVMLGLSLNAVFGTYSFENFLVEQDQGGNADYVVLRNGQRYAGLDAIRYRSGFESELAGVNVRGGLSAEVAPGVRAGLTLETPTFYQIRETYTLAAVTTTFLDGGVLSYGNDFGDDEGKGEYDYRVRTPWRLGAGLAVSTRPLTGGDVDLTLRADLEYVDWSQMELDSDFEDFAFVNRRIREDFEATLNTRLGAELRLGDLALRGGFAYQPDPRGYSFETAAGERADHSKTYLSAGLGYRFGPQFQFDIGWMQARFDDRYVPYAIEGVPTPVVGEEVRRNLVRVGLSYSF